MTEVNTIAVKPGLRIKQAVVITGLVVACYLVGWIAVTALSYNSQQFRVDVSSFDIWIHTMFTGYSRIYQYVMSMIGIVAFIYSTGDFASITSKCLSVLCPLSVIALMMVSFC